jgi:hypothetical protein
MLQLLFHKTSDEKRDGVAAHAPGPRIELRGAAAQARLAGEESVEV